VGQGSADVPFELEYGNEVVLLSPNLLSYAMPPIENEAPIPTPAPASTLADSDKENCGRCPMQLISQLVLIEEMVVDRAEDCQGHSTPTTTSALSRLRRVLTSPTSL
jgi:hypothetical protein